MLQVKQDVNTNVHVPHIVHVHLNTLSWCQTLTKMTYN